MYYSVFVYCTLYEHTVVVGCNNGSTRVKNLRNEPSDATPQASADKRVYIRNKSL